MPLPAPPANGIMPSVLGRYWVDAQFILLGAGVIIQPYTLTLQGTSLATQQLMADTTLVTTDDVQDLADSNAPILPSAYVIAQFPSPNVRVSPGNTLMSNPAGATPPNPVVLGIGYPVPTPIGPVGVP